MSIVRAIDSDGNWKFGYGKACYKKSAKAIRQNVLTRVKCYTNDWYPDIDNGIPWLQLIGQKNVTDKIIREVAKTVLQTEGVLSVSDIQADLDREKRTLSIEISYSDIYGNSLTDKIDLEA